MLCEKQVLYSSLSALCAYSLLVSLTAWLSPVGGGEQSGWQALWGCFPFFPACLWFQLSLCVGTLSLWSQSFVVVVVQQWHFTLRSTVVAESFLHFQVPQAHDYLQYTRLMPALIICRKLIPGKTSFFCPPLLYYRLPSSKGVKIRVLLLCIWSSVGLVKY